MSAHRLLGCLFVVSTLVPQTLPAQAADVPDYGHDLFHRQWSIDDPVSPATGDGLGPFFNARSCVACHSQGGSGGGGPNEHNVQLLTVTTIEAQGLHAAPGRYPRFDQGEFRKNPPHPALADQASVVVHRLHAGSRSPNESPDVDYALLRSTWLAMEPMTVMGTFASVTNGGKLAGQANDAGPRLVALVRSERNTPSLFGARLIDGISATALQKLAAHQNHGYPEISGRVAPGGGKFGWRGQTPSLRDFVVGACANELGLQTSGNPQPKDFVTSTSSNGIDMYEEQIVAMVNYIGSLDPPASRSDYGRSERAMLKRGRGHFSKARCDACHVAAIGSVGGIYSDLLLHDMGSGLADPAALSTSLSGRGYYGTANLIAVSDENKQEWRTPPLWGVKLSAPYLHDGRAETIETAIAMHGGEAETSTRLFHRLSETARRELVAFVKTL